MKLESTNFYATNFALGAIPPTFIHQLGRIDAEIFQPITTDCRPPEHGFGGADEDPGVAYTLSLVFYHRQVCSHARGLYDSFRQFAKRLAYGFVTLSPDTS